MYYIHFYTFNLFFVDTRFTRIFDLFNRQVTHVCIDKETDVLKLFKLLSLSFPFGKSMKGERTMASVRKSVRTNDLKQSNPTQRATVEFVK